MKNRFGSTMTTRLHRYGAAEAGPMRSGSIQGMKVPTRIPSATASMMAAEATRPPPKRPNR